MNHRKKLFTFLAESFIMKNGKIDKYLFEGGYAQATSTGAYTDSFAFNYYNQDHLGNNREVVDASGSIVQVTNYYPFGTPYADASASQNPNRQQYKYNGQGSCQRAERKLVFSFPSTAEAQPKVKELDIMHGLNTYDYGARQNYPILCRWDRIDPLCEKYYNVSPYNYCMNNPVKFIDPDGRDWYRDEDGTYQFDPNIHKQEDLNEGQTYIASHFTIDGTSYRKDGSILFNNEVFAYNRIWNEANKKGKEIGAFITEDLKVLVLPDYKNKKNVSFIEDYGYETSHHKIKKGNETFEVVGQIHTHQKGSGDPTPSFYNGDDKVAEKMKIPVVVLGHNNKTYAIISSKLHFSVFGLPKPFNTVNSFLASHKYSFAKYLKDNKGIFGSF